MGAPCAEILQYQEMWGLYEQSLAYSDSVQRLMRWEFEDSKARRGCSTLQQVATDVYKTRGCTFVERMLCNLYCMGFSINSHVVSDNVKHSIVGLFEE